MSDEAEQLGENGGELVPAPVTDRLDDSGFGQVQKEKDRAADGNERAESKRGEPYAGPVIGRTRSSARVCGARIAPTSAATSRASIISSARA